MAGITLYFISETVPGNTHASSAIFYRHFKRLEEEGYQIVWVTDVNSYNDFKDSFPQNWRTILLPNRRWNLPPYRAGGVLQAYRFYYYYRILSKKIVFDPSTSLLITYINGQFLAPFSAYVKQRSKLPLLSFFHDDILELNYYKDKASLIVNTDKVLEACDKVLVASPEFSPNWIKYEHKFQLLYPIPEKYDGPAGAGETAGSLTFGYSGAVYDEIIPSFGLLAKVLRKLGCRLLIVGDKRKTIHLQDQFPETVSCQEMFGTPGESNAFLAKNCHAVLIAYPERLSDMPWIATCFPSKFLQYCQLSLPTMIIAPDDSAIGKWCKAHAWPLYSNNYQIEQIANLSGRVNDSTVQKGVNQLKDTDFNPDKIHGQLVQIIKDITLKY